MNRLRIGSIITATFLLIGCGGGGGSSNSTSSSLSGSSTPTNSSEAQKKIGTGYYVDSAVEGVDYKCGNESGITDENGTFTFESGSNCEFTLGGIKLRKINASLLEDNVTVLENNETVAQLLQTLDSDGNATNGIQIPEGAGKVIEEIQPSLNDLDEDLLEVIHNRLKSEYSNEYNGTVVDTNQTIEHLNRTKAELEARHIRTHLDVEAEHRANQDNNGTAHNNNSINENSHNIEDNNNTIRDIVNTHGRDANETAHNNSSIDNSNIDNMMGGREGTDSNNTQEQEYSDNSSSHSQSNSSEGSSSTTSSNSSESSNHSSSNGSTSSSHTSSIGGVGGF